MLITVYAFQKLPMGLYWWNDAINCSVNEQPWFCCYKFAFVIYDTVLFHLWDL